MQGRSDFFLTKTSFAYLYGQETNLFQFFKKKVRDFENSPITSRLLNILVIGRRPKSTMNIDFYRVG